MNIKIICDIGDTIYIYDPEDKSEYEKIIDNIVITRNGDNPISDKDILLKADEYDNCICTYDRLVNTLPDEGGLYYFRCKKSRTLFKESIMKEMCKCLNKFYLEKKQEKH